MTVDLVFRNLTGLSFTLLSLSKKKKRKIKKLLELLRHDGCQIDTLPVALAQRLPVCRDACRKYQ